MKREIRESVTLNGENVIQLTLPDERFYQVRFEKEGEPPLTSEDFYPSCTWICSYYPKGYALEKWLADKGIDKAEEIRREAGQRGSRVHKACEDLAIGNEVKMDSKYPNDDGELAELTADEYGVAMTFRKFLEDEQPYFLKRENGAPAIEYTVLNHEHKFGGTVDMKCRIKSDDYKFVHIIDIKTSKDIYPSHEIQVSAYLETDKEAEKIDILQVGYRRNENGYKLTAIEPQFDLFLHVKGIWQREQKDVVVPQRLYPLSLSWIPLKEIPTEIKKVAERKLKKLN